MPKRTLGYSVLDAAKERISYTFDNFEKIYVSFSGGKDSTVMLHLVMDEAIKRNRKVGILFIDLEGQYEFTIDHINKCYDMYKDYSERFWVCLPIALRNAVSVYEPKWICWDDKVKDAWVRELPADSIHNNNHFPFFYYDMEFEEFVPEFGKWYGDGKSCACFVGIRSDESLNRYRTISSTHKARLDNKQWTTFIADKVYNIYPVYDWKTSDVWIYQGKNPDKPYNHLYDLMYKAGLTIHQMRICQPYGDDQRRGLWLFHLIEPQTWGKIVARVNGANAGAMYVQESGNMTGYRRVSCPAGHTWNSFAQLLLNSMPPKTQEHFKAKISIYVKWWMERCYPNGIPDEVDRKLETLRQVPSWRRVCKALLRNDYWCKGIGFSQTKSDAYSKYLGMVKKKRQRWNIESDQQLFITGERIENDLL